MKLIKSEKFGTVTCDIWKDKENILFTRKQIGEALEYSDPQKAIDKIHSKNKDRLDKFSVTTKVVGTDGKKYDTCLYTQKGIYEICRWSKQQKANEFMDWAWDQIDNIREALVQQKNLDWQEARSKSKESNKSINAILDDKYIPYITEKGSSKPKEYYRSFAKLINKNLGIENGKRDFATPLQLTMITVIEPIILQTIRDEVGKNTEYHEIYKICRKKVEDFTRMVPIKETLKLNKTREDD